MTFKGLPFNNLSYWEKTHFLEGIDLLIVGSGLVGLSTAIHYKRSRPNAKVLLLERGIMPSGASTKNAGFACIGSPSELLADLEKRPSDEVFETLRMRWEGLNYLKELLGPESINHQKNGAYELFLINDETKFKLCYQALGDLNHELQKITGIDKCFKIDDDIIKTSGFSGFSKAISHAAEGQIDPGLMIKKCIQIAQGLGISILNGIEVQRIDGSEICTQYGNISFNQLAICSNGLAKDLLKSEDIQATRAQIILSKPLSNLAFKGIFHFDEGYYYFRNLGQRILFGGARNKNFSAENTSDLATSRFITDHLKEVLTSHIAPNEKIEIEHAWAGTMGLGKSKKAILKKVSDQVYCGVRLGGMGIAIGSLIGKQLSELIISDR